MFNLKVINTGFEHVQRSQYHHAYDKWKRLELTEMKRIIFLFIPQIISMS